MSIAERETELRLPSRREAAIGTREQKLRDALTAELQAALAREQALMAEKQDLSRRQAILALEFEHRLLNSLQLIASLLSLQSRTATPEAAAQLTIAGGRVAALGRVHRQLHVLDHKETVQFGEYLRLLCADLASLLFQGGGSRAIAVEGAEVEIPTLVAIPLGFIVNELITNCAKYGKGNVIVRFRTTSLNSHSLSVLDEGPGLPAGFDPAKSRGLGMKLVLSLVAQIGGALHIVRGNKDSPTHLAIVFGAPVSGTIAA